MATINLPNTSDTPSTHDDETDIPDTPTPGGEKPDDPTTSADQPDVPGDITIPGSDTPKADAPSAPAEIAEETPPLAEAPETGDHQEILLSAAVAAASLAGIIGLYLSGRKRRKNDTNSMRDGN